jgi:hypothetical protein
MPDYVRRLYDQLPNFRGQRRGCEYAVHRDSAGR